MAHIASCSRCVLTGLALSLAACGAGDGAIEGGTERGQSAAGGARAAGEPPRGERRGSSQAVKIVAETVELRQDEARIEAVGTARANKSAVIFPATSGLVTRVNFKAGDRVARGAVLAELENDAERLAVARAEVAVADAEQLLSRYTRIDVPGAISASQLDAATTSLRGAEIDLDLARLALSQRRITAPFAGHVGLTDVDAGARVTSSSPITRLDDRSALFVDFDAPEDVFGQVAVGDALPLEAFSGQGTMIEGTIVAIDSSVDPARRSFSIRGEIDNRDDRFRPGMSFRVAFAVPGRQYPAVPEEAIVWGGDGAYVWAIEDGRATQTGVDIIARQDGLVLVAADLEAGDQIVAEGIQKVRDGARVDALEPREAIRPASASGAPATTAQP